MADFKKTIDKEMAKLWKTSLKSSLKEITYSRETAGTYDPVTETTTGGVSTSFTLQALQRDISKDARKDDTITLQNIKLTVKRSDFVTYLPLPNSEDKVVWEGQEYRVARYQGDVTDTFYHLFLRGI